MPAERQRLEAGIAALETQRVVLGDIVVDAVLTGLRERFARHTAPIAHAPAQSLKQVSILFLDVAGSTGLSQHLDRDRFE